MIGSGKSTKINGQNYDFICAKVICFDLGVMEQDFIDDSNFLS